MRLEVMAMIRFLLRALAYALTGPRPPAPSHPDLQHAHWDRSERRWLSHEGDPADLRRAA